MRLWFLTRVKMVPLISTVQGFTSGTIGIAMVTNVTNIWQQIMQTKYSMGKSTNVGKVT